MTDIFIVVVFILVDVGCVGCVGKCFRVAISMWNTVSHTLKIIINMVNLANLLSLLYVQHSNRL